MSSGTTFALKGRNPDVLSCIANLSNDEVFTPPEFANQMLDTLAEAWANANDGANLWGDPQATFLDPFTKSGVFLREITRRLVDGLADEMPDLRDRVDHILSEQVYGIATTTLTSLLARRSLYCSKFADGEHSIAKSIESSAGNIWFERVDHSWEDGRCRYCRASQEALERGDDFETHAYAFLHTDDINARVAELFGEDMQFDVIVGNPPYQLSDGGHGASAMPIYHRFVESAKLLEPRFLSMVIPSRWFAGGRALNEFRQDMLNDDRLRVLEDYLDSRDCFPGVDVAGGVCYFVWDREQRGPCRVVSHSKTGVSAAERPLMEPGLDVFVRHNDGISILHKVMAVETGDASGLVLPTAKRFSQQVSAQKPFGLRTYFRGRAAKQAEDDVRVLQSGGEGWVSRGEITEGVEWIDKWKCFTSKSSSEHAGQSDKDGRRRVLSRSGVLPPGTATTETYVLVGAFDTEAEARNCFSYITTRFFRFLILLRSSGQDISRAAYGFVPIQDFSQPWTDEQLYTKYGLTDEDVAFIEAMIRPMDGTDA